jgi:hypothetical protein
MNPDLVRNSENKIKLLKEQLNDLHNYKGELNNSIIMEWLTGVAAPLGKSGSDIWMLIYGGPAKNVVGKFIKVTGETIQKSYETGQKIVDISNPENSSKQDALHGIEGVGGIIGDRYTEGVSLIGQSILSLKKGEVTDSIKSLSKGIEKLTNIDGGFSTGFELGENLTKSYKNSQDILSESERLRGMFDREIQKVQEQIMEEEGLLYKHSNGEKGNIQGLLNSKNQFRRLDGVLMQIEKGIQRVKVNLG